MTELKEATQKLIDSTTNTVGYKAHAICIMNDPTASDWLRRAVYEQSKRDIVDAYHDALTLAQLLAEGLNEALPGSTITIEERRRG